MSEPTWAELPDDELDDLLRREMAVLRATAPAPRADASRLGRARPRFVLRDPATAPRRLAPAGLAIGLAVLLAVGSGTWYAVQRLHERAVAPAATPRPRPSAPPAPTSLPGSLTSTVPAGVPVFWYATQSGQPTGAVRLEAVDWGGAHRGHLDIPGVAMPPDSQGTMGILQSPDGERLLVLQSVYSSDGRHLYDLPARTPGNAVWGDDSRTLCLVTTTQAGTVTTHDLVVLHDDGTRSPNEAVLGFGDQQFHVLKACAVSTDRVVDYVQVGTADPAKVQVHKLSSNQVLLDQAVCPPSGDCGYTLGNISVSSDGRLAAESDRDGQVRIRDLTTGRLRTLSPRGGVLQLSADGTRLLLGRPEYVYGGPVFPLTLVDVASGRVLWSHSEQAVHESDAGSQPGGSTIAVAYHYYDHSSTPPPNAYLPGTPSTLVLLRGGTATTVATDVHSLFFRLF